MFTIDIGSTALFHSNRVRCVTYKIPGLIEHKATSLAIHTNICSLLFSLFRPPLTPPKLGGEVISTTGADIIGRAR